MSDYKFSDRDVANFVKEILDTESRRNELIGYLDDLTRDRRSDVGEKLMRYAISAYALEYNRTKKSSEDIVYDLVLWYAAARAADDRGFTRNLSNAEMDDLADMGRMALEIIDELAEMNESRSRGYGRDDRRGGGRESSFGRAAREQDRRGYSAGGSRGYGGGRQEGYRSDYSSAAARGVDQRAPQRPVYGERTHAREEAQPRVKTALDVMAEMHLKRRQAEAGIQEPEPQPRRQERRVEEPTRRELATRNPVDAVRRNHAPAYERVTPETITSKPEWTADPNGPVAGNADFIPDDIGQWGTTESGKVLPSPERPITQYEILNNCYDLNDIEVVEAIPERPRFSCNGAAPSWEADEVAPQWSINKDGYRVLAFRKLSEEEKEKVRKEIHTMPEIIGVRNGPGKSHPQREAILLAAGKTTRFNLEEARRREEEARKEWEDVVAVLKAENETLPEEEQKPIPDLDLSDYKPTIDETVKVGKVIKAFGHDALEVKIMDLRTELDTESSLDLRTENYRPLHDAGSAEAAREMIEGLRGLVITGSPVSNVTLPQMLRSFENRVDGLPGHLIVFIKRHIVNVINDILGMEMGSTLTIDDVNDLRTIEADMVKIAGEEFAAKFSETVNENIRRFEFLTTGEDMGKPTYIVSKKSSGVLTLPVTIADISMKKRPGIKLMSTTVNRDSAPKLYQALNMMNMAHGGFNKELYLADGTWVTVTKDAMAKGQFVLAYKTA
ncbi:hypothetical protein [Serratia phage BUCT660]|nr:hypothetical protein [Serratia phage BUCT660]